MQTKMKRKKKPPQIHENLFQNNNLNYVKRQILNDEQKSEAGLKIQMTQKMTQKIDNASVTHCPQNLC